MNNEVQVLVATNAFGMGINKPDIRQVIHHTLPASIEAYHQETGRAGRDGSLAQCTLCYDPGDIERIQFINTNYITDDERENVILRQIAQMKDYAEYTGDHRQFIIDYFNGNLEDSFSMNGDIEVRSEGWSRRHG
jgi:ATP-dependent DNA helicase RecQ